MANIKMLIHDIQAGLTYEQAYLAPKIFTVQRKLSPETVFKIVAVLLKSFADSIKVDNKLDNVDIFEVAESLIRLYPCESIKDFILCLREVKCKGTKLYNRLSTEQVLGFFQDYFEAKARWLENRHLDQKSIGYGQQQATCDSLLLALPQTTRHVCHKIDPYHPNREHLRKTLSLFRQRHKRGLLPPDAELSEAWYQANPRKPRPGWGDKAANR